VLLACVAIALRVRPRCQGAAPGETVVFVKQPAARRSDRHRGKNSVEFSPSERSQGRRRSAQSHPHRRAPCAKKARRSPRVFGRIVTKKTGELRTDRANLRPAMACPCRTREPPCVARTFAALKESRPSHHGRGAPVWTSRHASSPRRMGTFGKPDPFLDGIPDGPVSPGAPAAGLAGGFLEDASRLPTKPSGRAGHRQRDVRFAVCSA